MCMSLAFKMSLLFYIKKAFFKYTLKYPQSCQYFDILDSLLSFHY